MCRARVLTPSRPCGPGTTRTSSPVRPRDPLDVRPQAVVAAAETELIRRLAQLDVSGNVRDLLPRNAHDLTAGEPCSEPADQARAPTPRTGPAEDRDHLEGLAR